MDKGYKKVVCECGRKSNVFSNVVDAYQKGGYNHYEYQCECGKRTVVKIKIVD